MGVNGVRALLRFLKAAGVLLFRKSKIRQLEYHNTKWGRGNSEWIPQEKATTFPGEVVTKEIKSFPDPADEDLV